MYLKYQPLVDYLGRKTGRPWELVLLPSYQRAIEDLCSGKLTIAYLGPYTYVRAHDACEVLPLVKLRTHGRLSYRGLVMVRKDSPLRTLGDLAGKTIGFGAPMSTASNLVARGLFEAAGLRIGVDLACRHYVHHEQAVRAVLLGEVDACAVRDIVGEQFVDRGALRVLLASDEIPNFPLVLAPGSPPALREELLRVLLDLPVEDRAAASATKGWDEELAGGFGAASDEDYEPIRKLALRVFGQRAMSLSDSELECRSTRP
jgi:phosphonate transport system substrate-binding protein